MAEVFRAVGEGPEGFERAFVVKRIHPHLSDAPEFIRMFVDEAKISARLVHPNIVQVFEFVYEDGGYYIVMEPVDGVDMGRVFRRMGRKQEVPPPLFFAEVARQVCRGLEFAHGLTGTDGQALGVVHRDVTPPNIMVDWNGTVKILDFGIARAIQELRTKSDEAGIIKGKMSYVAPEQLEGKVADARSDVFSLAVVLHELLSGRRLFLGENDLETLKLVQGMPIVPPSTYNPGVKPQLDAIVMRALERDPARRYQSAREMGDDLEEFVVRRHFSMQALAEKARELAPVGDDDSVDSAPVVALEGDVGDAPSSIGRADAAIALAGAAERRRKATTPPPPPELVGPRASGKAPVSVPAPVSVGGSVSGPVPARLPARSGFRLSAAASWVLLVVSFSALAGALFLVVMVKRGAVPGDFASGPDDSAPGARAKTVQVLLDSVPQGATVTAGAGKQLGQTPLVVRLPRGDVPVDFLLAKTGFAPLSFRLIANRDKDAVATLVPTAAQPVVAATGAAAAIAATVAAATEETPRRRRKSAARRAALAAATTAAAPQPAPVQVRPAAGRWLVPVPSTPVPARPVPQSPAVAGRGQTPALVPAARPVALVPAPAPRR